MIWTFLSTAVWLICAAGLQAALSQRLAVGWAQPDFLLIAAVILSLQRSPQAASATGFFAGLFSGALLNERMTALVISRTLVCVLSVKVYSAFLGRGALTAAVVTAVATLAAGVIYLLLALEKDILGWLADTMGAAIYNGVVAVPAYGLHRWLSRAPSRG
ncbi:MAG: hypothetical protein IH851_11345 [Armatimonadetes bacterium]|nr:hypothetical protein [Armatimonadota bacterium]